MDKIPFKINGPGNFNFKLNNNYRDYTMGAREYLGYKLHQEFTGIGSNVAPVEVFVNGAFYGIYLAIEDLNQKFYDYNLGGISQRVKARPDVTKESRERPYSNLNWLGENSNYYEGSYEIKKGSIQDFIALLDIINNDPGQSTSIH